MNKRFLFKIVVNVINVVILFSFFNYFTYFCYVTKSSSVQKFLEGKTLENALPGWSNMREQKHIEKHEKKPIVFLGCSYTFGFLLPIEKTFPYLVEKLTKRYCCNYGLPGYNITEALLLLDSGLLDKKENLPPENPEYIVYTYMFAHFQRNCQEYTFDSYRKRNIIPNQSYNFLYRIWFVQYIQNERFKKYLWKLSFEEDVDLFFKIFEITKSEFEKKFPNTKFIVLLYSDVYKDLSENFHLEKSETDRLKMEKAFEYLYSKEIKERFEKLGCSVVSTEDLIGRKMDRPEDRVQNDIGKPHPSVSAWEEIVPKFVKYFDL